MGRINNPDPRVGELFPTRLKEFVSDEDTLIERFEDAYNEDLLVNTKIELDALILSLSENINM